ncbi:MAG: hypothetical protein U0V18_05425 [Anaerolineales bacterium]
MKGSYIYTLNGQPTEIVETFEIDGDHICSERVAFGTKMTVNADLENDRVVRFDMRYGEDVSAKYTVYAWGVEVERFRAGKRLVEQKQVTGRFEAFPLMRIFMGRVIRQLEALGGQGIQIVVPWIFDPKNEELFLSAHVDVRSAKRLDGDLYQYIGENYDETARFWIDARGLLTRYTWKQNDKEWDVNLYE